jgi:hypothetical protein
MAFKEMSNFADIFLVVRKGHLSMRLRDSMYIALEIATMETKQNCLVV